MRDVNSPTPERPVGTTPPDDVNAFGAAPTVTNAVDAPAEPASVHVIVEADRTCIVLSGEVDADLTAELRTATADAEAAGLPIEIDSQHVTFMDSSGVAFLARLATRSQQPVRMVRVPENVRFLLEVTRIGELLEIDDAPPSARS